jgi:alpha-L-fucosidase
MLNRIASTLLALCGSVAITSAQTDPLKLPPITDGPFKPSWESLANYQTPEWFSDAKFGIWAHWGPQCEP